jgi:hypothetical protein
MRKIVLSIAIFLSIQGLAQNKDSLLQVFPSVKGEAERIRSLYAILDNPDPQKGLQYHKKLLAITRKQSDKAGEAYVTAHIGWAEYLAGNMATGAEIEFKALRMAEDAHSEQVLGWVYLFLGLYFSNDPSKAKSYLDKGLAASTAAGDYQTIGYELRAIANYYDVQGKTDSALYFNQRCIEVVTAHKLLQDMPEALVDLGYVNYKLGRKGLALEYYREALREPYIIGGDPKENADDKAAIYGALSNFYRSEGNLDSALYYARLRYQTVQNISFRYRMSAANSLWKSYVKINSDSALKYAAQYYSMKDSTFSAGKMQQMQALALLEEDRQQKISQERKHNLQYAAIALGVVVLTIFFFLFSHSVIANQRLIKYLGILALLIVFEFINLFIHPYLDKLTGHSVPIMLCIMVAIAALLIPLHHKLEHWITHRLVEKNKRIRLAAAKKTIAKLEGK